MQYIALIVYCLSCIFYSILCIFSIIKGIEYFNRKKKQNNKKEKQIWVKTIILGITYGITAIVLIFDELNYLSSFKWYYGPKTPYIPIEIAIGFTAFYFCYTFIKIWNNPQKLDWIKIICYSIILFSIFFLYLGGK